MHRLFAVGFTILLLVCLSACTGSTPGSFQRTAQADFELTVMPESYIDGASSSDIKLIPAPTKDGASLDVAVSGAVGLKALYVSVSYDPEQYHFKGSSPVAFSEEESLTIAAVPGDGEVHYGHVLKSCDERTGFSGNGVLARLEFARGAAPSAKAVAAVSVTDLSAARLNWDSNTQTLDWHYASQGDYDQNGLVAVTDLTPLGRHFGKTGPFGYGSVESVVDGDLNNSLNVSDLTPIGVNFNCAATQYFVMHSTNAADYPGSNTAPKVLAEKFIAPLADAVGDPAQNRLRFTYPAIAHTPDAYYWVRASDGTSVGTPSNLVGGPTSPLTVIVDPASADKPLRGIGSLMDPYIYEDAKSYQLQALHDADGDVTNHAETSFNVHDLTQAQVTGSVLSIAPGASLDFSLLATYQQVSSPRIYFSHDNQLASFDVGAGSQPFSGTGSAGDPYRLDYFFSYNLAVIHPTQGEITNECAFVSSEPVSVPVTASGTFQTTAGFTGAFNISVSHPSVSISPVTLYFEMWTSPPLTIELETGPGKISPEGGTGTEIDPFRVLTNARYSIKALFDHNELKDASMYTPAYVDDDGYMILPQGTGDFTLHADYSFSSSNDLYFEVVGHNESPVVSVSVDTDYGNIPLDATLDGSMSYDPELEPLTYEWRLGPELVGVAHTIPIAISYVGSSGFRLLVTDDKGISAEDTIFVNTHNNLNRDWHTEVVSAYGNNGCSAASYDSAGQDKPTVAVSEPGFVDYLYSATQEGSSFTEVPAIDGSQAGYSNRSGVYLDQDGWPDPVACYLADYTDPDPDERVLRIVKATDQTGTAWATPVTVFSGVLSGDCEIHSRGLNPMAVFVSSANNIMAKVTYDSGATWADNYLIYASGAVEPDFNYGYATNHAAIAFKSGSQVIYKRSSGMDGTAWSEFTQLVVDQGDPVSIEYEFTDRAVVAWADVSALGGEVPIRVATQNEAYSAFESAVTIVDTDWTIQRNFGMTVLDGKPAIAYYDSGRLYYRRAHDELGRYWGYSAEIKIVDARNIFLTTVNGRPVIVCNTTSDGVITDGTLYATFY